MADKKPTRVRFNETYLKNLTGLDEDGACGDGGSR
jgi:hypothetical protein